MAKDNRNVTEFGEGTVFEGTLSFTVHLIISGKFSGTIEASGDLEISKTSSCTVDKISANSVVVYGTVTGDIDGQKSVELCRGSTLKGDIKTASLRIADNVDFDGKVSMTENPDEHYEDLFSIASDEFKKALAVKSE